MNVNSKGLWPVSALAVIFVGAAALPNETYVPETKAYCLTGQPGANPVQILAADGSGIVHEGSEKRFEIDENALTCAYIDKSGDKFVYNMK